MLLYISSFYYELAKYDDALKTLTDFIKKHSNARDLMPIALQETASAQLAKGDREAAQKTLDTLYKMGSIYQDYALMESGRLLEKDGKKSEAAAKFKELTEKFPASQFFGEAKTRLEEKKEGQAAPAATPAP